MEFIIVCFFDEFFKVQKTKEVVKGTKTDIANLFVLVILFFNIIFIYFRTMERLFGG